MTLGLVSRTRSQQGPQEGVCIGTTRANVLRWRVRKNAEDDVSREVRTRSHGALETASVNLDFILRSPGSFKQGNDTIKHLSLEDCAGYIYKTLASGAGRRV